MLIYASFKVSGDNYHTRDSLNVNQSSPIPTYSCIIGAGLGSIIVLKSLLGLYGAIKRSKSILATYATILSIIVLLLLVMLIFTYIQSGSKNKMAHEELDKAYVNLTVAVYNYVDSTDPKTSLIDYVQKKFSCCGVNSPNDWVESPRQRIPKSCCSEPVESSLPVFKYCSESDFKIGCGQPLQEYFYQTAVPIIRDFILIKIYFNVFCIALAGLLIRAIKKDLDVV